MGFCGRLNRLVVGKLVNMIVLYVSKNIVKETDRVNGSKKRATDLKLSPPSVIL